MRLGGLGLREMVQNRWSTISFRFVRKFGGGLDQANRGAEGWGGTYSRKGAFWWIPDAF